MFTYLVFTSTEGWRKCSTCTMDSRNGQEHWKLCFEGSGLLLMLSTLNIISWSKNYHYLLCWHSIFANKLVWLSFFSCEFRTYFIFVLCFSSCIFFPTMLLRKECCARINCFTVVSKINNGGVISLWSPNLCKGLPGSLGSWT